jgi:hypothetical protein
MACMRYAPRPVDFDLQPKLLAMSTVRPMSVVRLMTSPARSVADSKRSSTACGPGGNATAWSRPAAGIGCIGRPSTWATSSNTM